MNLFFPCCTFFMWDVWFCCNAQGAKQHHFFRGVKGSSLFPPCLPKHRPLSLFFSVLDSSKNETTLIMMLTRRGYHLRRGTYTHHGGKSLKDKYSTVYVLLRDLHCYKSDSCMRPLFSSVVSRRARSWYKRCITISLLVELSEKTTDTMCTHSSRKKKIRRGMGGNDQGKNGW